MVGRAHPTLVKRLPFLLAWTIATLLFLYLPIILLLVYSFNVSRLNIRWEGFTFDWYRALFRDRSLIGPLKNSLIIAALSTAISLPLGTSAAWGLFRYRPRFFRVIDSLALLPIVMPDVIIGISLLVFFAMAFQFGGRIGLPDSLLGLGFVTVIIAHVTFCFPFVMVTVRARLASLDPALEEAAMDLGATPSRAFFHVILPFLMPAIVSAALLAFTLSMDELIITLFTYGADATTLPVKAFGMARVGMNPSLNAISAVLIVMTAGLMSAADWFRRRADIR